MSELFDTEIIELLKFSKNEEEINNFIELGNLKVREEQKKREIKKDLSAETLKEIKSLAKYYSKHKGSQTKWNNKKNYEEVKE